MRSFRHLLGRLVVLSQARQLIIALPFRCSRPSAIGAFCHAVQEILRHLLHLVHFLGFPACTVVFMFAFVSDPCYCGSLVCVCFCVCVIAFVFVHVRPDREGNLFSIVGKATKKLRTCFARNIDMNVSYR